MTRSLWGKDLADTARSLRASPTYSIGVVLILGAVVGALSAVFALNALLLFRALPYVQSDRLVEAHAEITIGEHQLVGNSPGFASAWMEELEKHGQFAMENPSEVRIRVDDVDRRASMAWVSPSFFDVLGVAPAGEIVPPAPGEPEPVVLSHGVSELLYGDASGAVGQFLVIEGTSHPVVAVMDQGFLSPGQLRGRDEELWLVTPRHLLGDGQWGRFSANLSIIGRVAPGQAAYQLDRQLEGLTSHLLHGEAAGQVPPDLSIRPRIQPLRDAIVGDSYKAGVIVLVAATLLALLGLSIVGAMMVARWASREPTLALHAVVGARMADLRRQVAVEMLLLVACALLVATPVSYLLVIAMRSAWSDELPRLLELRLDARLLLSLVVSACLMGLASAWIAIRRIRRQELLAFAPGGGKGAVRGISTRLRTGVLSAQFLLLMLCLFTGGLVLADAMGRLLVDPGYEERNSVFVQLEVPPPLRTRAAKEELEPRLTAAMMDATGATGAAIVDLPPISPGLMLFTVRRIDDSTISQMFINGVGPEYLESMGMNVIEGRVPAADEHREFGNAIVLGKTAAELLGGDSAVGQRVKIDGAVYTVVGVVNDVFNPVATMEGARLQGYIPFLHYDSVPTMAYFLFGVDEVDQAALRTAVESVEPGIVVDASIPTSRLRGDLLAGYRTKAWISGALVLFSILVACAGILAVTSYLFHLMRPELSVHLALGARFRDLVRKLGATMAAPLAISLTMYAIVVGLGWRVWASLFEADGPTMIIAAIVAPVGITLAVVIISRTAAYRSIRRGQRSLVMNLSSQ